MNGTSITLIAAGRCTIQASQSGSSTYNAAPTVSRSFDVTKASQTISFGPLAPRRLAESPVAVSATASSGLAVTFATTNPAVCRAGGRNGSTIRLLAVGTCSVQATQAGDSRYAPAAPVTQIFDITP